MRYTSYLFSILVVLAPCSPIMSNNDDDNYLMVATNLFLMAVTFASVICVYRTVKIQQNTAHEIRALKTTLDTTQRGLAEARQEISYVRSLVRATAPPAYSLPPRSGNSTIENNRSTTDSQRASPQPQLTGGSLQSPERPSRSDRRPLLPTNVAVTNVDDLYQQGPLTQVFNNHAHPLPAYTRTVPASALPGTAHNATEVFDNEEDDV